MFVILTSVDITFSIR